MGAPSDGGVTVDYDAVTTAKNLVDGIAKTLQDLRQTGTITADLPGNADVAQSMDQARALHAAQMGQIISQLQTAASNLDTAVASWQKTDQEAAG